MVVGNSRTIYLELYLTAIKGEVSRDRASRRENMRTLHSAHKYVNAIQRGNEALKDVHRQNSSCVPANSPPVVRINASAKGRETLRGLLLRNNMIENA